MRQTVVASFLLIVSLLTWHCNRSDNRPGNNQPITGQDRLTAELVGGWRLISAVGETENWYFTDAGGGRYVRLSPDVFENGYWSLRERDILLNEGTPRAVQVDGNILKIGNLRLQRDTSVKSDVEQRLSRELKGTWISDDSMLVYEFMDNNYYQKTYTDDPDIPMDGDWYLDGLRIVENNYVQRADPVTFIDDGRRMRWGAMDFFRQGDLPERFSSAAPDAESPDGERLREHTFSADLGRFGSVVVSPYQEREGYRYQLKIYLRDGGRTVYTLPEFPGNRIGEFDGLRAIAARDVDRDGNGDLLVMADFLEDAGSSLRAVSVNAYYRNLGRSFRLDRDMTDALTRSDRIRSINDMVAYIQKQRPVANRQENTREKGTSSRPATSNYRRYRNDKSVCRIRVAALREAIDYDKLNKLSDLGILSYEPADNGYTYVYLGKYISKYTAYRVLDQVKRRGHRSAYVIVEQDYINQQKDEDPAFSTFQIASYKKLNVRKFNELDETFRGDVYITYGNGHYRLSMGLYQKQLYPYIEEEFKNIAARLGYGDGFSRTID